MIGGDPFVSLWAALISAVIAVAIHKTAEAAGVGRNHPGRGQKLAACCCSAGLLYLIAWLVTNLPGVAA